MKLHGLVPLAFLALAAEPARPGAFLLDEMLREADPAAVVHPIGYDGTGGAVTVSFCIDPSSDFATELVVPSQKAITTLNNLVPTTGTYVAPGDSTQVPAGQVDVESILLHEMGHCMNLGVAQE